MANQIVIDIASLRGKRSANEDMHMVETNISGADKSKAPINAYGVFDGHGGKFVSKFLATYLPHIMMDKQLNYPLNKSMIKKIFQYLQQFLKTNYARYATETGSTCLVVAQYSNFLDIINIGDSKCLLCRKNLAIPLTKEHRPSSFEEHSRITSLGGNITQSTDDDPRIHGLSVSRSVGDLYAHPYVTADPDLYRYRLTNEDKFFVLGCDGLYDYCTDNEIVTFVLKHCYDPTTQQRIKCDKIAKKLGQYAIEKGSTDNVTIIIVFLR